MHPPKTQLAKIIFGVLVFLCSSCSDEPERHYEPSPQPEAPTTSHEGVVGACEFYAGDYDVYGCYPDETESECRGTKMAWGDAYFHPGKTCSDIGYDVPTTKDYFTAVSGGSVPSGLGHYTPDPDHCLVAKTATLTLFSKVNSTLSVYVDGNSVGSLTKYYPAEEPTCGQEIDGGTVILKVSAGSHLIEASSSSGDWSKTVTLEPCACNRWWFNP